MSEIDLKKSVNEYLERSCFGKASAVKADKLAGIFGTSLREINDIIRQLRKEGWLIGSSKQKPYGYYVPANVEEARQYLNCFRSELMDMLQTFNRQRRAQHEYIDRNQSRDLFSGQGRSEKDIGIHHVTGEEQNIRA